MVPSMKDTGRIIKLTERELSGMYMATNMKVSGREIKPTVTANIHIVTAQLTKEIGGTIFNTDKVLNSGTTTRSTKANTKEVRNMAKEPILGKMAHSTQGNGVKTEFMAVVSTPGTTEENTKVTGKITTWMVTEFTPGRMAGSTKDSTRKIKNMEVVSIPGLMAVNTTVNGKTDVNMAVENTYRK